MAINEISGWSAIANYNPTALNGLTLDQLMDIMKSYGIEIDEHIQNTTTIRHIRIVKTVAELRLPYSGDRNYVLLLGRSAIGDGGHGLFYWDTTSTVNDNGGFIVKVSDIPIGRWRRIYNNIIRAEWFSSLSTCISAIGSTKTTLEVSSTINLNNTTVTLSSNIHLKCNKGTLLHNGILNINGTFEAGNYIVFYSDVAVTFSKAIAVNPAWYTSGNSEWTIASNSTIQLDTSLTSSINNGFIILICKEETQYSGMAIFVASSTLSKQEIIKVGGGDNFVVDVDSTASGTESKLTLIADANGKLYVNNSTNDELTIKVKIVDGFKI